MKNGRNNDDSKFAQKSNIALESEWVVYVDMGISQSLGVKTVMRLLLQSSYSICLFICEEEGWRYGWLRCSIESRGILNSTVIENIAFGDSSVPSYLSLSCPPSGGGRESCSVCGRKGKTEIRAVSNWSGIRLVELIWSAFLKN